MKKSIGLKKFKTAVFISGTGSNLKNLIKFSKNKKSPIQIECIVSDKINSKGLKYAKKFRIKKKVCSFIRKKTAEKIILDFLKKNKVKLICLAGFMKILSTNFIKKFDGKILNIHPSLLPKYKGLNTYKKVIKNRDKYTGCTVHFVTAKLDSGKIIMQKKVKVNKKDSIITLKIKVQKKEYQLYPAAIRKVLT